MREAIKYIMYVYFIPLFMLKVDALFCQTTFSKTIDFNGNQESAYAISVSEDYLYLIGNGLVVDDGYIKGIFICKTDLNGNVIWRRTFISDSSSLSSGSNSITDKNGNIYITGGKIIEPNEESNVFFCSFDPLTGDTIRFSEFIFPGIEAGFTIQWMPDSTLLIYGLKMVGGYSRILLMNIDTTGGVIFNKYYGDGSMTDSRCFQLSESGNISIAFGDSDCDPVGYTIQSVDDIGNVLSTYQSEINCLVWGVPGLYDDGYFIASYEYYLYKLTFFAKLNADFTYAWKNYFLPDDLYLLYSQYELADGNIIVFGSKLNEGETNSEHAFLRKINNYGETVWERQYYTEEEFYPNYIWDITATASGELICVGTGFGEPLLESGFLSQNFWLLKLDSLGCLEIGCDSADIEIPIPPFYSPDILIFPNPLTQEGTIQINAEAFNLFDVLYLEIECRNLSGQMIEEFTVDRFYWTLIDDMITIPLTMGANAPGVYFIQIKTINKILGNLKVVLL